MVDIPETEKPEKEGKIMRINMGSGDKLLEGYVNCDIQPTADLQIDLTELPWPFEDNSAEVIAFNHVLEHFDRPTVIELVKESHRVLKPGGCLHIQVPHASSRGALQHIDHKSVFWCRTLQYMTYHKWLFEQRLFATDICSIWYLPLPPSWNPYYRLDYEDPQPARYRFVWLLTLPLSILINLHTGFFERIWCHWVGGASEMIWRGRKI